MEMVICNGGIQIRHGDSAKGQENSQLGKAFRSSDITQTRCVSHRSCSTRRSSVVETAGDLLKTLILEIPFREPNTSCEFLI